MVKKLANKKSKVIIKSDSEHQSEDEYEAEPGEKTMTFGGDVEFSGEEGSYGEEGEDEDDMDESGDDDQSVGEQGMYSDEEGVSVDMGEEKKLDMNPSAVEERKKQRRIDKLDKKIKFLQKKQEKSEVRKPKSGKYEKEANAIKNKHKRQEVVLRRRMMVASEKKLKTLQTKKAREEQGEEAVPKGKNSTIESMRVPDETMMDDPDDEDNMGEQNIDEFDKYFNRETTPKILMTTNRRPKGKIFDFMKELKITIPNMEYYPRDNNKIKDIIEWSKEREFTDIVVLQEKWGIPHSVILSHLPDGPTATFRISSVKLNEDIPNHGANNGMLVAPELILNNFDTMLGSRLGRMIASLFPQDPHLEKRRVITWHNQRDYIFFRHHRYEFNKDGTRANLSEVGPRFTLKLHKLQLGTLDSRFGEYEFLYKPKDGVNRKKFFL